MKKIDSRKLIPSFNSDVSVQPQLVIFVITEAIHRFFPTSPTCSCSLHRQLDSDTFFKFHRLMNLSLHLQHQIPILSPVFLHLFCAIFFAVSPSSSSLFLSLHPIQKSSSILVVVARVFDWRDCPSRHDDLG
ncbi:unnamed protein product [Albugo candida]|uniref:Uncharacterized protein n=1 Tax=Albugo candida TaxID=65357 RepID=A0A024GRN9_9STRA|nr:unnamed protein product [Albugo candida]|eukprot:CCI49420.1 unnamed protein product [Albugo candida]